MQFKGRCFMVVKVATVKLHSRGILTGGIVTVSPGAVRLIGFRGCLENATEYQFPIRYRSHFFVRCRIRMEVHYRER
jgi:hypothetical protein